MYQHGRKPRRKSNPKNLLHASILLGASFVLVAIILHNDLAPKTESKTTVPIISEVAGASDKTQKINEPLFSLELPEEWSFEKRVQERWANYYEWKSPMSGGRVLRLYIDIMPGSYKLTRLLPVTVNDRSLQTGNFSSNCIDFATNKNGNNPVEARWEGVVFVCDPVTANQTIGTGNKETGIGTKVGEHTYFFYLEDHNIRPDFRILTNIVKSFKAK